MVKGGPEVSACAVALCGGYRLTANKKRENQTNGAPPYEFNPPDNPSFFDSISS